MIVKKMVLSLVALVATLSNLQAHALWIHTNQTGKVGQKHSVRVTYAELGDKPEKISDWYSDVPSFELWLTGPDQQKTKLTTVAGDDFHSAEFIPTREGVYTLTIGHSAKDLGGATQYQFNTSALVAVGSSEAGSSLTTYPNELSIFPDIKQKVAENQAVGLVGLFKSIPSEKIQVTIHAPNGWTKQVSTNVAGKAEFTPLWPGEYLLEATKTEKASGEQGGNQYEAVWRCATYVLSVPSEQ